MKGLDAYITGVNDPHAPFNRVDYPHPRCDDCQSYHDESCDPWESPCLIVAIEIQVEHESILKAEKQMYYSWLLDATWKDIRYLELDHKLLWAFIRVMAKLRVYPCKYLK